MAESPESTISTSLRLTKALSLARQGKLKSAELLLAPENVDPTNPIELHAVAALVTHEGDYLRALRLWRLLLQKQPENPEARRMIPMLELWISRPAWYRHLRPAAWIAATLALGLIALWAVGAFNSSVPTKPANTSVSPVPTAAPASNPPAKPIQAVPTKNSRTR